MYGPEGTPHSAKVWLKSSSWRFRPIGVATSKIPPRPIVEFYYKNDELDDPLVTEEHAVAFITYTHNAGFNLNPGW